MSGIRTFVGPNYRENLTPDGVGGLFHSLQTFSGRDAAVTDRRTFYDLAGRNIIVLMTYGGNHNWQQGVDGNGYPYLQAQGSPTPDWWTLPPDNLNTTFAVFSI
jgi:hypothetical protein